MCLLFVMWRVWLSKRYKEYVSTYWVPLLEYKMTLWEDVDRVSSSPLNLIFFVLCLYECLTVMIYVHECVCNVCRINFYSRFPSANDESLNKLRFVSVEQLPIDFIPRSPDCPFLPVASIDLIICTFVAFLGLVLCIFIVWTVWTCIL